MKHIYDCCTFSSVFNYR